MTPTPSTKNEAEDLKKHAERLAKALRLLLRAKDPYREVGMGADPQDAADFARLALLAWEKRQP